MALGITVCTPPVANESEIPPVQLFNGTGTSANDVAAIEANLQDRRLKYSTVNSRQLNRMDESQLAACQLVIFPGGNYITIGNSLTPTATANIHNSVKSGLNSLGICAGGLLAGNASCNSFDRASGVRFGFSAELNRGVHKAAVAIPGVETPTLEPYWDSVLAQFNKARMYANA